MSLLASKGRLTTHVLDTALGRPAAGLRIDLYRAGDPNDRSRTAGGDALLTSVMTNADGRTDQPLLGDGDLTAGSYELLFHAGDYLATASASKARNVFLDLVPIRFTIADPDQHYHVPLLLAPFGYSTYRGS